MHHTVPEADVADHAADDGPLLATLYRPAGTAVARSSTCTAAHGFIGRDATRPASRAALERIVVRLVEQAIG